MSLAPEVEAQIAAQASEIERLRAEVAELRRRLDLESSNSSKPPSSDWPKKKPRVLKSLRTRTGKRSGGQKCHRGDTLRQVAEPDAIVERAAEVCAHCQARLLVDSKVDEEKRQVFDLPEKPLIVREHRAAIHDCWACGRRMRADFPEGTAVSLAQYGERIKVLFDELVGEGNREVGEEPEGRLLEGLEPDEEIVSGPLLLSAYSGSSRDRRPAGFCAGRGLPGRRPNIGSSNASIVSGASAEAPCAFAVLTASLASEASRAGRRGPGLLVEFADRLKLAQEMGFAEGLIDVFEAIICARVVVDHDATLELGHGRAGLGSAIERVGQGRGGVQPAGGAGDAEAGFVEAAHQRRRDACAAIDRRQRFGLAANPAGHARAAGRRCPEQVLQHLRGSLFGHELLGVEIDGRRL